MTNVGAWNPKKFRPKIKFIFLEAQKVYDLTKIFGFLKFLKRLFPFPLKKKSSKMNATLRDLFKNIIVLGNQGILCSNLHIFNFKFDEPLRCAQNSDQNKNLFCDSDQV